MTEKRKDAAPPVVALLPLSSEVNVQQLWDLILGAFLRPGSDSKQRQPKGVESMDEDATTGLCRSWTQLSSCHSVKHTPCKYNSPAMLGK